MHIDESVRLKLALKIPALILKKYEDTIEDRYTGPVEATFWVTSRVRLLPSDLVPVLELDQVLSEMRELKQAAKIRMAISRTHLLATAPWKDLPCRRRFWIQIQWLKWRQAARWRVPAAPATQAVHSRMVGLHSRETS